MGLRIQKRINVGKGLGINVSKSGFSTSFRSKSGSFSSKGYSIRSGIPGISYRGSFGKAKSGCLVVLIVFIGVATLITIII
jgi:hypothetical protein